MSSRHDHGEREVEDQCVRRIVSAFSRQYDIMLDLDVTSFVSDSRVDFVHLDAVSCARSNRELNLSTSQS